VDSAWERLPVLALPALARLGDGRFVLIARADRERVLVHDPAEPRPLTLPREGFEARWSGRLVLVARRAGAGGEGRRFDFSWFVPALVKHRRLLGEVLVASFFIQLFALVTPLFFQVVVDKVLVHQGFTTLHVIGLGMLVLVVFEALLGGLRTYVFSHTAARVDVGLGAQLYRHLLRLPVAYFQARRVGDTVARVRELETIRQFLTGSTLTLVLDLFFTGVFVAVMMLYSPLLTGVVLGSLPLYALLALVATPLIRARLREKFDRGAESQAFLVETVNAVETVKAMAVEPAMERRWEAQLAAYVGAAFRANHLASWAGQGAQLVNRLTTVATLWIGAHLVVGGELTVGQLIAFNLLAGRVSGPVLRLAQLWQDLQQAGISVERLGDVLNARAEPYDRPGRSALPGIVGRISLEGVTFRYRADGPEVLRRLSLEIAPGEVVGIVGRSGSGKSTVARLVQRLHVPESGRVLVDGVDLAQVDPVWLRRQVGVVLQENVLFNRSVRENIALADPGMPIEQVVEAAGLAGAHEFILELPEGYDTLVGEHGATLSGGQRQRIAIARALVTNPRILILDEATSALDYESEAVVQRNMARICRGRTVVIIAHRLSTVRRADRIVVIERGEVVEEGTHDRLVQHGGYYARLHRHQEGLYAVP
jgi:subfamily B ATP-binding cassette protein HlyB/CyaB